MSKKQAFEMMEEILTAAKKVAEWVSEVTSVNGNEKLNRDARWMDGEMNIDCIAKIVHFPSKLNSMSKAAVMAALAEGEIKLQTINDILNRELGVL